MELREGLAVFREIRRGCFETLGRRCHVFWVMQTMNMIERYIMEM
jgi:hypothetical protein